MKGTRLGTLYRTEHIQRNSLKAAEIRGVEEEEDDAPLFPY